MIDARTTSAEDANGNDYLDAGVGFETEGWRAPPSSTTKVSRDGTAPILRITSDDAIPCFRPGLSAANIDQ